MKRHEIQNKVNQEKINKNVDKAKYEERFGSIVNHGFIALGIAIGHKLGLFSALREFESPVSSEELAKAKNLKERYVREWLGSMVAAEIVFITDDNKYYIPGELSGVADHEFFATLLPAAARKTDDVVNCFKNDGPRGFNFSEQTAVFEFLEEEKKKCDGKWLDENLVPLTLKPKDEIKRILDIGSGSGRLTINLANHFPDAFVIGVDVAENGMALAKVAKEQEGISNVEFVLAGAEAMPDDWKETFDWIVAAEVLHDMPNLEGSIECIKKVLKKDGILSAMEPAVHSNHKDNVGLESTAGILSISCFICLPCSLSCEPAVGYGAGWGLENRAKFLKEHGFDILGDETQSIIHCKKVI